MADGLLCSGARRPEQNRPPMPRGKHRGRALLLAAALAAAGVSAFTVAPGGAQTGGGALAQQATQLASQITTTGQQLDAVNEQVNGAAYRLQQANAVIADDEARIAAARLQVGALLALVHRRAVSIYRSAFNGYDASILSLDPIQVASSQKYTQAASDHDNTVVGQLDEAKAQLAVREKEALSAQQQAKKNLADLEAAQAGLRAKVGQLAALNAQVQGPLVPLVAAARTQQDSHNAPPADVTHLPPPSGRAGAAVAYAEAQINKSYCTGGTGPTCFDCSGLTMMAWAQAGVSLPHFSGAQYSMFLPEIPMSALLPGDLVFTANPADHVGIYVGGGTVVHATSTANNPYAVRAEGLGFFSHAVRPH
jgi:cell wall-associated NlpC family hydrolase